MIITVTTSDDVTIWQYDCDVILNSNPKFRKEIKKRNKIRKNSGPNIGKEPDLTNPEDLPEYI